jgi:hypothetical protein
VPTDKPVCAARRQGCRLVCIQSCGIPFISVCWRK